MRSNYKVLVLIFTLFITSVIFTKKASAQQSYVSFQVFYDQLSPYGEWVDYPRWGYVWIPDAGPDFVPYSSNGYWILTDYGWTWMSDYRWGWAPFHYGRWDYDQYYGWFWIPDNEWGPAWVNWRRSDGYYGWAPMEPGISLSVSFDRGYNSHSDHWVFVRDRDFDRPDINRYAVNRRDHDLIIRHSTIINNTYFDNRRNTTYITGPDSRDIQKVTGRRVSPIAIKEYNKPGQDLSNGQFGIYRPEIRKNNDKERKVAPSRITNLRDIKQPSERNVTRESKDLNVRPSQPMNTNPPDNIRREARPNNVKSDNADPTQNIRREAQPNNAKSQKTDPPQNIRREAQPNNSRSQNADPPQNIRREAQQNNVKSQNADPPQNIRREAQQNNVKSQNANPPEKPREEQQSSTTRQSRSSKKEQQKKSNAVKDIK